MRVLACILALVVGLTPLPPAIASAADSGSTGAGTTLVRPPFGHCMGINRATPVHLFLYLGSRTSFDEPAGLAAVKLRSKDDPDTGRDDDELTVFGLNSGRSEILYNTSLTNVEIFGGYGSGDGRFDHPLGIAADEWGGVVVADTGNDRIVRLRYIDDALRFTGTIETVAAGRSSLSSPSRVALGASGAVYVTDTGNDRLLAIDTAGAVTLELLGDEASGARLESPVGLAVVEDEDPWLDRRAGRIVIADRGGSRLLSFDTEGTLRNATEAGEGTVETARFDYLAIDYHGSVYATDTRASVIHKFDRHLRYVTSFGRPGTDGGGADRRGGGARALDEPRGIAIWRRFGQVFITERQGARYFWMGTEIRALSAESESFAPGRDPLRISYDLTEVSRVSVLLRDASGTTVHTLAEERRRAIGPNVERWNGILEDGRTLPPGEYTLVVTARPVYSSRAYFQDIAELPLRVAR